MSKWRKSVGVVTLSGAVLGAAVWGVNLFQDGQFAMAEQNVSATRQQLSTIQDTSDVYRQIHRVVEPSVVEIRVIKTIKQPAQQIPPEMQRFFHQFGDGNGWQFQSPMQPFLNTPQAPMHEIGTGSGVIMDASDGVGYILTNNHVAGEGGKMIVTLSDGRVIHNAELVGADPKTDLAVVRIKASHLIPAVWGDSTQLAEGDTILAFGAPFGYVGSMTHGIVSALHRRAGILGMDGYENFIQVDAPINPGNSGGPLVNLHGQVVGINTAIASSSGGFQGIGFAIPSEEARPIYEQLKSTGKITRGYLGVEIENVTDASEDVASEGYRGDTGVLVKEVLRDGPAADELQPGDVVTGLDGQTITNVTEFRNDIANDAPGSDVTLQVFRDGGERAVHVKLGIQPSNTDQAADQTAAIPSHGSADLGIQLQSVNDDLAQQFGFNDKSGAVVTSVAPNSPAAQAGIQPGDVITHVGTQAVHDADEAERALSRADLAKGVRLQIDNSQGSEFVFVRTGDGQDN